MTLVFGAIPPVAMVLALPILLPSVPAEKVVIDNDEYCNDDENYGEDDDTCQMSENCIRRQVLGNKYLVYMNHHQNNQGGDSEGGTKSTGEIIKAVLR